MGDSFSVTFWVRFLMDNDVGTFLTLYSLPSANSLSDPVKFLEFTDAGVTIYEEDELPKEATYQFESINDMEWHQVSVMWHKDLGLNLTLDSIRQHTITNTYAGKYLNMNVWVVLGAKLDMATQRPMRNMGFKGLLSQLNLYNRNLHFTDEGPIIIDFPQKYFPNLTLGWNEYILYKGVSTSYPSFASRSGCSGSSHPICVAAPDKMPPVTHNCPDDIFVLDRHRPPAVQWTEPIFEGAKSVLSNFRIGETYQWDKHIVTYEARDEADNAAFCTFNIYVQFDNCSEPQNPINGDQDCRQALSHYVGCTPVCNLNNHRIDRYTPNIYTCGKSGSWYPADQYRKLIYPSCGEIVEPVKKKLVVALTFPNMSTTNCDGIKNTLIQRLQDIIQWMNANYSSNVCSQNDCPNTLLKVDCGVTSPRTRRSTTVSTVTITIPAAEAMWTHTDTSTTLPAEDVLTMLILETKLFDFSSIIPGGVLDPNGFTIDVEDACSGNRTAINGQCVMCGPGNYFDVMTRICLDCPVGQFQDQYDQQSCEPCGSGYTTESVGSNSNSMCKESCEVGHFYDSTKGSCVPCEVGFYQNQTGQFHCLPCPPGQTTRENGSVSVSMCKDDCPSGQELSPSGTCRGCEIGTYRTQGASTLCVLCPAGNTTVSTNSTSITDCSLIACNPGFKRVGTDMCMECPIGTYQPEKWQTDCKSCGGDRYRTDNVGSVSSTQCRFFCPDGQENQNGTCVPCELGFYKNNTVDIYGLCQPCPGNRFTEKIGSISEGNCTFQKCSPGYVSNAAGDGCVICPKGYYQALPNKQKCDKCMTGNSTRQEGSTHPSQCEKFCANGQEKNSEGGCDNCLIGFYKNNSVDQFMNCTKCPQNYVTANVMSGGMNLCTVRDCPAGMKRNSDDTGCISCPRGTFQSLQHQINCTVCPNGKSTRQENSTASTDCEAFCDSGQEKLLNGSCVKCEVGYFKDNMVDKFSMCTLCSNGNITPGKGSISENNCTVANCSAGYKRNVNTNQCEICPVGYYQENKWQTECEKCSEFKTTANDGSTNRSECVLVCPEGYQDVGGTCTKCPKGFFKSQEGATPCEECPENFVTPGNGSIAQAECSVPACKPGFFLDISAIPVPVCRMCAYDTFQAEKWQESCEECPTGKVTLDVGSNKSSDCVLNCSSGSEYDMDSQSCVLCMRGYYRDMTDRSQKTCQMCRSGYITASVGALSAAGCNIKACTELGTFRDSDTNTCKDCAVGSYTDEIWRETCTPCPDNYTTRFTKSNNSLACQRDCNAGTELRGSSCVPCPIGMYRNKSETWACKMCPNGLVTAGTSASSASQCTVSPCLPGSRFVTLNDGTGACENCPVDTYQPNAGEFSCMVCPDGGYTEATGSSSQSQCISHCGSGRHNCSANAQCTNDATSRFTCTCDSNYEGDGVNCTHKCDTGYCLRGTCNRTPLMCTCPELYTGDRCEIRQDPSRDAIETESVIIGASIGAGVFVMIVLILVVCCCVYAQKTTPPAEKYKTITEYPVQVQQQSQYPALMYSNDKAVTKEGSIRASSYYEYDNAMFHGDAQNPEITFGDHNETSDYDPAFYTA